MPKLLVLVAVLLASSITCVFGLTCQGHLAAGDPLLFSDAVSLSLGVEPGVPEKPTLSLSVGLSSIVEEAAPPGELSDHSARYLHPPSFRLSLPLSRGFHLRLGSRPVFDYNYSREAPIYDDLREGLTIGVESVSSTGYLYSSAVGMTKAVGRISLGGDILISAGWRRMEHRTSYYDPGLWTKETSKEDEFFGLGAKLSGAFRAAATTELSFSYISSRDVGEITYPSAQSFGVTHQFGEELGPCFAVRLQSVKWSKCQEGFSNTLRVSVGSQFGLSGRVPFRFSLSSEPWYGGNGVDRLSLGLGTEWSTPGLAFAFGAQISSGSGCSGPSGSERANEILVTTLLTSNYSF